MNSPTVSTELSNLLNWTLTGKTELNSTPLTSGQEETSQNTDPASDTKAAPELLLDLSFNSQVMLDRLKLKDKHLDLLLHSAAHQRRPRGLKLTKGSPFKLYPTSVFVVKSMMIWDAADQQRLGRRCRTTVARSNRELKLLEVMVDAGEWALREEM